MKLSQCTHGKIVTDGTRVGMIVGITNNAPSSDVSIRTAIERAIIMVQWSEGETRTIHPSNIEPYKD